MYWSVGEKNTFHVLFSCFVQLLLIGAEGLSTAFVKNIKNQNKEPLLTTKCQGTIFHLIIEIKGSPVYIRFPKSNNLTDKKQVCQNIVFICTISWLILFETPVTLPAKF